MNLALWAFEICLISEALVSKDYILVSTQYSNHIDRD